MGQERYSITIVGCGPGGPDYITPAAKEAIDEADVLVGAERLLELFPGKQAEKITAGADIEMVLNEIDSRLQDRKVVVLVTGDPGLCSLARPVIKRFGRKSCTVIPGISSLQVAFARIGMDWLSTRIIDAHGENPGIDLSLLKGEGKIAVFAGRDESLRWVAALVNTLGDGWRIYLCEELTLPGENIREIRPADLDTLRASPRTIVLIIREELFA